MILGRGYFDTAMLRDFKLELPVKHPGDIVPYMDIKFQKSDKLYNLHFGPLKSGHD